MVTWAVRGGGRRPRWQRSDILVRCDRPRGAGPERATTRWNLEREETDADSVQIQSPRPIRNAKSLQWLRKRLVARFERVCVRLCSPREGLRDARNRLPFGWSRVGTMDEESVRTPVLRRRTQVMRQVEP